MSQKRNTRSPSKDDHLKYEHTVRSRNDNDATLSDLTDGYKLKLNDPNVAQQIRVHPTLSQLTSKQRSNLRRDGIKRKTRQSAKEAKNVSFKGDISPKVCASDDDAQEKIKDPDYSESETSSHDACPEISKASIGAKRREKRRLKAIQMINHAHKAEDGNQLRESVIKRLAEYGEHDRAEFEHRCSLLETEHTELLAHLLVVNDRIQFTQHVSQGVTDEIMLTSFLKAATRCQKVVKDQAFLVQFLIPRFLSTKKLPELPSTYNEGKWNILRGCLDYYSNCSDPNPPPQFYAFAHEFNAVRELVLTFKDDEKAQRNLRKMLSGTGLDQKAVKLMMENQYALCFSKLIKLVAPLEVKLQLQLCEILLKSHCEIDPSDFAIDLLAKLRRNVNLGDALQEFKGHLPLDLDELIEFMAAAEGLKMKEIRQILSNEMDLNWLKKVQYLKLEKESGRSSSLRDEEAWQAQADSEQLSKAYSLISRESKVLEMICSKYCHIAFQCYAAARIYASDDKVSIAHAPTGCGKTFIAALLAKVYQDQGNRVAVITSNAWLSKQMQEMMGDFSYEIQVYTIQEALLQLDSYDVAILDEADECIVDKGILFNQQTNTLAGFWDILAKRSVLLSGSLTPDLKNTLNEVFGIKPQQIIDLKLTLTQKKISAAQTHYVYDVMKDQQQFLDKLRDIIAEEFTRRPIIVFVKTEVMSKKVMQIGKMFGLPTYDAWSDDKMQSARVTIRHSDRGLVVVNRKFGRGTDIRFQADSLVLVTFMPRDASEAQQLAGRSSRTLNTHSCHLILQDSSLDEIQVKEQIHDQVKTMAPNGARAVRILLGMRLASGYTNDAGVALAFARGWAQAMPPLIKALGKTKATKYEALYQGRIRAKSSPRQ